MGRQRTRWTTEAQNFPGDGVWEIKEKCGSAAAVLNLRDLYMVATPPPPRQFQATADQNHTSRERDGVSRRPIFLVDPGMTGGRCDRRRAKLRPSKKG